MIPPGDMAARRKGTFMGKVSAVTSRKRQYLRRFLKNEYLGDGEEREPGQSRQRGRYEQRH